MMDYDNSPILFHSTGVPNYSLACPDKTVGQTELWIKITDILCIISTQSSHPSWRRSLLTVIRTTWPLGYSAAWDCLKQKLLAACQTPFWSKDWCFKPRPLDFTRYIPNSSLTNFLFRVSEDHKGQKIQHSWPQRVDLKLLITVIPLTTQCISFTPATLWNNPEPGSG